MPAMQADSEHVDVEAAGGVVRRAGPDGVHFAVVHRPRHDDWSFPKGKLQAGESFEQAALREVQEEVGVRARLGEELPPARYDVAAGRKLVRYWLMDAETGTFTPTDEVDEVRWLSRADAEALLSHPHDRALLRRVSA
jgi:8-oxo-dGTP pyrophosphatase MutT (NUDIX family)